MTVTKGTAGILVVDDEESIRGVVSKYLSRLGYAVAMAATAEQALEALTHQRFSCVLLDINLPGRSGIDLLPSVLELDPNIAVIMVTGTRDGPTAALCMRGGVADYLTKPFDLAQLSEAIERALEYREKMIERKEINHWLREEVNSRKEEIRQEGLKLERLAASTLEALVGALEAKDPYMAGHSIRVAQLAASIAAEMGHSDEEVELIRLAGRLHDIGMIGISVRDVSRQGPLTPEEFEAVKQHVVLGSQILAPYGHLGAISRFVRGHHERWDGGGYPDGLSGESIPWGAQVISAAEIYDAMTTARPYQEKTSPSQACERMQALGGKALDPAVLAALTKVARSRHALEFIDDVSEHEDARAVAVAT